MSAFSDLAADFYPGFRLHKKIPKIDGSARMGLADRRKMYITYNDVNVPAKIALTKLSRRTKVLVYGKLFFDFQAKNWKKLVSSLSQIMQMSLSSPS